MRHVVFVTSGIASVRNANFEFARRLAEGGFRVTYASPSDIGEAAERSGLPFVYLGRGETDLARPSRSLPARLARSTRLGARRRAEVDGLGVARGIAALDALSPDLILIDLELHAYVIGTAALAAPVALVSTWLAMSKRPGLAPLHRFILPGTGWRGWVAVEWAWFRYRVWKAAHRRIEWLRRGGTDRVSVLRTLAARSEFSFRVETDMWQWPLPFSYRRLPLLLLNAIELDLPHTPPPNVRYVGPMMSEPIAGDPTEDVEQLLTRRARDPESSPLVYASFGSFFKGDDTDFIRRFLDAVKDRTDWEVVLALGGRLSPAVFGPQPAHVRIFDWVPQVRVISSADVSVLHGGITSINESLWFGIPMVVYPLKTNEQLGNAVRVEYHGLGIVGDRDKDAGSDIDQKIEAVIGDPKYGERAREMRDRFRVYDQRGVAVAAVEELIGRRR